MSAPDALTHSIRVGVFPSIEPAQRAISRLTAAGFKPEQLTVVCSGEAQENYFKHLRASSDDEEPRGEITSGATLGATLGGLSAIAIGAATGAVPLIVAGMAGAAGGGAMGGFVGVMTSKGVRDDFLNACHEQVLAGKILVAAEDHSDESFSKLSQAADIFLEEGSEMDTLQQP